MEVIRSLEEYNLTSLMTISSQTVSHLFYLM